MENNKPILSICIPTYCRSNYLKECLDSIIYQDWFNDWNIEIVISDNASTDNTIELVNMYQEKYNNIRYHRNEENIWAVLNVLNIINLANWEYCWLMSDDDTLEDNKIILNKIIKIILNEKPNQIIVNYKAYDKSLKKITHENVLKIDKDIVFENWNQFLEYVANKEYLTEFLWFISIRIFEKKIWAEKKEIIELIKSNTKKYMYPHIMILFFNIYKNKIIIVKDHTVKFRWGNADWLNNNYMICYIISRNLYKFLNENINNNIFKLYLKRWIIFIEKQIIILKISNLSKKIWIYWPLSKFWRKYILKQK